MVVVADSVPSGNEMFMLIPGHNLPSLYFRGQLLKIQIVFIMVTLATVI